MKWTDLINMLQKDLEEFYVLLTVHLDTIVAKKKQIDAQLILSIFCQTLHVSGVTRPIIRRHNRMYTTVDTYYKKNKNQLLYT